MFSRFYESLYLKALINIVISETKVTVYVEMLNKQGVVSSSEEEFALSEVDTKMYEYVNLYIKETPYHYVSILDNSSSQGAIPTCSKQLIPTFCDLNGSEYKCYKDKWIYYTAKDDIYEIEKKYSKIGVDFIFSPFVVLANFFKDKIDTHLAMFILVEDQHLSLSVFDSSELLYAESLSMDMDIGGNELIVEDHTLDDMDLDNDESIDLDDIDVIDDIDELDDLGDIADLDAIEEIDEFSEAKDIEEELLEAEEDQSDGFPINDADGFNEDYQRFSLIQSSTKRYYRDKKYKSEFIENIYIADAVGVSGDLKKYLEEEMFLNVYIRNLDLPVELCDIAKMELS
jgi:hypothetical protein